MYEANPNYVQVANHLGIPESTLRSWVNRANDLEKMPQGADVIVEIYDDKKIDFVAAVTHLLDLHLKEAETTIQDATHHEVIGGIKVLFDVNQLLTGGATSNQNQRIVVKYAD